LPSPRATYRLGREGVPFAVVVLGHTVEEGALGPAIDGNVEAREYVLEREGDHLSLNEDVLVLILAFIEPVPPGCNLNLDLLSHAKDAHDCGECEAEVGCRVAIQDGLALVPPLAWSILIWSKHGER